MDEFEGNGDDPGSLHKYLYSGNDPVNKWDPTGRKTIVEFVTANLGKFVLAAIAVLALSSVVLGIYYLIARNRLTYYYPRTYTYGLDISSVDDELTKEILTKYQEGAIREAQKTGNQYPWTGQLGNWRQSWTLFRTGFLVSWGRDCVRWSSWTRFAEPTHWLTQAEQIKYFTNGTSQSFQFQEASVPHHNFVVISIYGNDGQLRKYVLDPWVNPNVAVFEIPEYEQFWGYKIREGETWHYGSSLFKYETVK